MVQKKLPLINSAHGSETRNIINELIKLFNGMGYTYNEALQKAHNVLNEAEIVNNMNENVQEQLDNLIIDNGNSEAEVINARGGFPVLRARLDGVDQSLKEIGINIMEYEHLKVSISDGYDWQPVIQAAVDYAVSQGGGKVLIPSGDFLVNNTIMLDSHISLVGNGRFNTTLKTTWKGQNVFQSLISNPGTDIDRREGIEVAHFGVDCSNLEFWTNNGSDYEAGRYGRIEARYVDNFHAHDIYAYHGSHVFEIRSCTNFTINRIITDFCFNTIHMLGSVGPQEKGLISDIIATRCATVVDFGAGGGDVIISDIYADAAGYVRNDQEAFDIGGATNVLIKDSTIKNFGIGATLKYEEDAVWDKVRFHNVSFEGFEKEAIYATIPTTATGQLGSRLELIDCRFYSDKMESSTMPALYIQVQEGDVYIENMQVEVNGASPEILVFKSFEGHNINIKSVGKGMTVKALEQNRAEKLTINGLSISSSGDPLEVSHVDYSTVSNFDLRSEDGSLTYRGVHTSRTSKGRLETGQHSIRYFFYASDVGKVAGMNYLPFEVSDVDFVDWGKNNSHRAAILFIKSAELEGTGAFIGVKLKDLRFKIADGLENNQVGLNLSAFDTDILDYSVLDNLQFLNVPNPQAGGTKGANNIENIIQT